MSEHTPGPWTVDARCDTHVSAGDRGICSTGGTFSSEEDYTEANRANARLIAAAPELFDALAALLARYVSIAESGDCGNWDVEDEPQVKAARAAIAKTSVRAMEQEGM